MQNQVLIVDVFAAEPLSGNPLAVLFSGEFPTTERMQRIAAEMNFSETTFVRLPERDGKYTVRIFTPVREIEFTGHPLIGTAAAIRTFVKQGETDEIVLDTAIGAIPICFQREEDDVETAWMRAPAMQFGKVLPHEEICASLGLAPGDLEPSLPVQVVSAGTSAVMVPVRTADALSRAKLDLKAHARLVNMGIPNLTYLFCREVRHRDSDFQVRFFFEAAGVREDPATGNGAAFFGAYQLEHDPGLSEGFDYRIEQGHFVHRPSLIRLRGSRTEGVINVQVGGCVHPVMKGAMIDD